jgi:hypothetical protein
MPKFKLTNLKFEQIMKDYAQIREVSIPAAVHANARLLCVELARRTQPFGDKTGGEKVGEKAISRDLLGRGGGSKGKNRAGIFAPLTPFMQENALFNNTSDNIRLFARKDGTVYGTDRAHFMPDASISTMRGIHKSNFVNGRMSAAGGDTRDIGRWKFINRYFVMPDTLKDYIAMQHAKVGIAKSGWAYCATQLKKVVSGSLTRGIPAWVTRHIGDYGNGRVMDNTASTTRPHVVFTNTSKYADRVLPLTEQLMAQSVVAEKMKKQMAMILKKRQHKLQEAA